MKKLMLFLTLALMSNAALADVYVETVPTEGAFEDVPVVGPITEGVVEPVVEDIVEPVVESTAEAVGTVAEIPGRILGNIF